MNMFFP